MAGQAGYTPDDEVSSSEEVSGQDDVDAQPAKRARVEGSSAASRGGGDGAAPVAALRRSTRARRTPGAPASSTADHGPLVASDGSRNAGAVAVAARGAPEAAAATDTAAAGEDGAPSGADAQRAATEGQLGDSRREGSGKSDTGDAREGGAGRGVDGGLERRGSGAAAAAPSRPAWARSYSTDSPRVPTRRTGGDRAGSGRAAAARAGVRARGRAPVRLGGDGRGGSAAVARHVQAVSPMLGTTARPTRSSARKDSRAPARAGARPLANPASALARLAARVTSPATANPAKARASDKDREGQQGPGEFSERGRSLDGGDLFGGASLGSVSARLLDPLLPDLEAGGAATYGDSAPLPWPPGRYDRNIPDWQNPAVQQWRREDPHAQLAAHPDREAAQAALLPHTVSVTTAGSTDVTATASTGTVDRDAVASEAGAAAEVGDADKDEPDTMPAGGDDDGAESDASDAAVRGPTATSGTGESGSQGEHGARSVTSGAGAARLDSPSSARWGVGMSTASNNVQSLDGEWAFRWSPSPVEPTCVAEDFTQATYDMWVEEGREWSTLSVPSSWQMHGYGVPIYTNIKMPFGDAVRPPAVPKDNPVGDYVRRFAVQEAWRGKRFRLCFEGADSALHVWLNGECVGFSKDSRLPAEFDVTDHLVIGDNYLAVRVYRWSDGSYLEDQDMWNLSGLFRSVYLMALPQPVCMLDYNVETEVGRLGDPRVRVRCRGRVADAASRRTRVRVSCFVVDYSGHVLGSASTTSKLDALTSRRDELEWNVTFGAIPLPGALLWSAETPHLYGLIVGIEAVGNSDLQQWESTPFGLRQVEINMGTLRVNGIPIMLAGVNRHEHSPKFGHAVSEASVEEDIIIAKQLNFNAIRTAHYPNIRAFYHLCDLYGMYVIDEANCEAHAHPHLSDKPEWEEAFVLRGTRMVMRDRNHPCIIMWSLGNEAGLGNHHEAMAEEMRKLDPSRPLHYEPEAATSTVSDVVCPMYTPSGNLEILCATCGPQRPVILCEYSHAMGNSNGGLSRYWERFWRDFRSVRVGEGSDDARLQGGFIWDFCDQAFMFYDMLVSGSMYYAYGGDTGDEHTLHDGNMCCNGLLTAHRVAHAAAWEAKHCQQPVGIQLSELPPRPPLSESGNLLRYVAVDLENRYSFSPLSEALVMVQYQIEISGEVKQRGLLDIPTIPPGGRYVGQVQLTDEVTSAIDSREVFVALAVRVVLGAGDLDTPFGLQRQHACDRWSVSRGTKYAFTVRPGTLAPSSVFATNCEAWMTPGEHELAWHQALLAEPAPSGPSPLQSVPLFGATHEFAVTDREHRAEEASHGRKAGVGVGVAFTSDLGEPMRDHPARLIQDSTDMPPFTHRGGVATMLHPDRPDTLVVRIGMQVTQCAVSVQIEDAEARRVTAHLRRDKGALFSLTSQGRELLAGDVEPSLWRAPTDNDRGGGAASYASRWDACHLNDLKVRRPVRCEWGPVKLGEATVGVFVRFRFELHWSWFTAKPAVTCEVEYTFRMTRSTGMPCVTMNWKWDDFSAELPPLPRVGIRVPLVPSLSTVRYFGDGPHECYPDRRASAALGWYELGVDMNEILGYVRPGECGTRTRTSELLMCSVSHQRDVADGAGGAAAEPTRTVTPFLKVKATGATRSFNFSALPFSAAELAAVRHPFELRLARGRVGDDSAQRPPEATYLHIDAATMGIGGDVSWMPSVDEASLVRRGPWWLQLELELLDSPP